MIWTYVEFVSFDVSFDELGAEISWIDGVSRIQAGGNPSGQSGGHLSPGGGCFAPCGFGSDLQSSLAFL